MKRSGWLWNLCSNNKFSPPPIPNRADRCFRHQCTKPLSLSGIERRQVDELAGTCHHQYFSWSLHCSYGCVVLGQDVRLVGPSLGYADESETESFWMRRC